MNFIELCEEVGVWSTKNFGQHPPEDPLLGVLEEIGEIAHSYLKSLQGIRGSEAEHLDAMRDGVGDAIVFLADFCHSADLVKSFVGRRFIALPFEEMSDGSPYALHIPVGSDARYFLFQCAKTVSRIYDYYNVKHGILYGIHIETLLGDLMAFCETLNLNFAECIMTTWQLVKQRDWTKNTQTGEI